MVKRKMEREKIIEIILLILFLAGLFYFGFYKSSPSGKVVSDLNVNYEEGQNLKGTLKISLKKGELIPASSKIIVENAGQTYEYILNEIAQGSLVSGNFYADSVSLSGSGEGYGAEGEKNIYPPVAFEMKIYSFKDSSEQLESSESAVSKGEMPTEKASSEELSVQKEIPVDEISTQEETQTSGLVEETSVQEEEKTKEDKDKENKDKEKEEIFSEENKKSEKSDDKKSNEEKSSANSDGKLSEEISQSPETSSESSEELSITGNIIKSFSKIFSNLFLGITGRVSLELENSVSGEVSGELPFIYDLSEGQTAEIVSSSEKVKLKIKDNQAIVSTDYSKKEKGFGKEYLGDAGKEIVIDLSALELMPSEGELKISLAYDGMNIVSVSETIGSSQKEKKEETAEDKSKKNVQKTGNESTGIFNETGKNITLESNTTINEGAVNETITENATSSTLFLSDEERKILLDNFGNASLKTAKAEITENRIVVRYEIGKYWAEYSYDYSDGNIANIEVQMQDDRIAWLKDLAGRLSEEKTSPQKAEEFIKDYEI